MCAGSSRNSFYRFIEILVVVAKHRLFVWIAKWAIPGIIASRFCLLAKTIRSLRHPEFWISSLALVAVARFYA